MLKLYITPAEDDYIQYKLLSGSVNGGHSFPSRDKQNECDIPGWVLKTAFQYSVK